jgi:hypothetical protein
MTDSRSSSAIADSKTTTHELGFGTKGPQQAARARCVQNAQPTIVIDGDSGEAAASLSWARKGP